MRRVVGPLVFVLMLGMLAACGAPTTTAPTASSASAPTAAIPATPSPSTSASSPSSPAMSGSPTQLTVFAAASLTEAFGEIGKNFEAAYHAKLTFNFAGSQQLAQQIGQGAPVDVFASANNTQMDKLIKSGQVISGTQRIFARNRLVVIYPQDNPAGLQSLHDLAKPGVKLVLADKAVPVGQYALDFLANASQSPAYTAAYSATVLANVVSYEENVRTVLSKVALGEADAGIVYMSDVSRDAAGKVGHIDIPDDLNIIASYPIAPIKDAPNAELAQTFIDYVLSPEAQQILVKYGFVSTTGDAGGAAPTARRIEVAGLANRPRLLPAGDQHMPEQVADK